MFALYTRSNFKKYTFSKAPTEGGGLANKRIWFRGPCSENKAKQCGTVVWAKILCGVTISQVFVSYRKKEKLIKKLESMRFLKKFVAVSLNFCFSKIYIKFWSEMVQEVINPGNSWVFWLAIYIIVNKIFCLRPCLFAKKDFL